MDFPYQDAKKEIDNLISTYQSTVLPSDDCPIDTKKGRMYELVVLGHLIDHLVGRGFRFRFDGKVLKLKENPGIIKANDPFFEGTHRKTGLVIRVYTDIKVLGLGCLRSGQSDRSADHEVDIIVVGENVTARPTPDEVMLGVECKSGAFSKSIIKEVLGVKRELSLLSHNQQSTLAELIDDNHAVPSEPAIEFWLAHYDPQGQLYSIGPNFFGIEFKYLTP